MKEGEIEDKDGNKLKVYWPKGEPQCESHGKGEGGCCPVGPLGTKGVTGKIEPELELGPELELKTPLLKMPALKEMLNKYIYGSDAPAILPIDDSLEKDIVESPVKGAIYKIRQINIIARYVGTHLVGFDETTDEGEIQRVVYEMHFRDMTLFINKEDLLLASEAEVETFIEK